MGQSALAIRKHFVREEGNLEKEGIFILKQKFLMGGRSQKEGKRGRNQNGLTEKVAIQV